MWLLNWVIEIVLDWLIYWKLRIWSRYDEETNERVWRTGKTLVKEDLQKIRKIKNKKFTKGNDINAELEAIEKSLKEEKRSTT